MRKTVYAPDGMFTAVTAKEGRPVLLVSGKDQVRAYDLRTGSELWAQTFPGESGCHRTDWSGETTYIVKDTCAAPANLDIYDAATGSLLGRWRPTGASAGPAREANWYVQPASCRLGRSQCRLLRAAPTADVVPATESARGRLGVVAETWSVSPTGALTREGGVESDAVLISGDIRVETMLNGYVWAHSRSTGALLWISSRPAILLTVDGSRAYLADRDRDLLIVDLTSGLVLTMIDVPPRYGTNWLAGYIYAHEGFLVIERLASTRESDDDLHYYYAPNPVLLVGV